jgi:hypothetical protein
MNRPLQSATPETEPTQRDAHGPQVLTQSRVCRRLGISDETWRTWRKRGITPPRVELPGHPRWRLDDIIAFEHGRRWRNSEGRPTPCLSHGEHSAPLRALGKRPIG